MIPGENGLKCRKCGFIREIEKKLQNNKDSPEFVTSNQDNVYHPPEWDIKQKEIIEKSPQARILVDAGPGTGKTAVACARVAWLIDSAKIIPCDIWLISFTRTAMQEIRQRICGYLNNPEDAYAVRIATIDSHAWSIHSGFDKNAILLGNYEDNIEKMIHLVRKNPDVADYLKTVRHILIDESQDIVGIRADLIIEIMQNLSRSCGITVFHDDAQAIYGFSVDEDTTIKGQRQKTFSEKVIEIFGSQFSSENLTRIFRTQSPSLKKIFTDVRQKVIDKNEDSVLKFKEIRKQIRDLSPEPRIDKIGDRDIKYPENGFILFRRRSEVLITSSLLHKNNIPHRIRMSGYPYCIYPWIGVCFSDISKKLITKKEFLDKWSCGVEGTPLKGNLDSETAWSQLIRIAGESQKTLDIHLLRKRLSQGKPPFEFCSSEIGFKGPIVGTIHASKGREAETVYLMMPSGPGKKVRDTIGRIDYDEEARVIFVGATRARKKLAIGRGLWHLSRNLEGSGRIYSDKENGYAMVEIGRVGDITASGIAGRQYFSNDAVCQNQNRIYSLCNEITTATGVKSSIQGHYFYRIKPGDETQDIAVLCSNSLFSDLFEIGKKIGGGGRHRPPDNLPNLKIYGVRTLLIPPGSPECNLLHETWARSGIMLAPVIIGYTFTLFPRY